ncbi:hypothetical protein OG709_35690 (plasmid) [Streptomyces sp. NBC_01267]|uniref:hypothetical protein n=1 Tax=Streptomyces sp. NBC_01267 TaxID=2903805 RepID=UPI002E30048F|nr:hypothetical protein [Streptomyces sp. NBC_01267]
MTEAGEVRLTAECGLVIGRYTPEVAGELEEPVSCPSCGATTGITLIAFGRDARLLCGEGHEWADDHIPASAVRQMMHLVTTGQPVVFPGVHLQVMLQPVLDEPHTLAKMPPDGEGTQSSEQDWWEIRAGVANHVPVFTECLNQARKLAFRALPGDGDLYARLYPSAGGSALDAHMSVLLAALAMYQASYLTRVERIRELPLADVAALLRPGRSAALRKVRPLAVDPDQHVHLRVTDIDRLETSSPDDWDRWARTATDLVAYNIEIAHRWLKVLQQDRYDPDQDIRVFRLDDRVFEDDTTWYATVR